MSYENTNLINIEAEQLKEVAAKLNYTGELLPILLDPQNIFKSNEERARLHIALAQELGKLQSKDAACNIKPQLESKESNNFIPSAVLRQGTNVLSYFEHTTRYLEKDVVLEYSTIVERIKKLREERKITYEDLGDEKYSVTMPYGSGRVKMYFPPDTFFSDVSYTHVNWAFKNIPRKVNSRSEIWSEEGQEYLGNKEKQGKCLPSKPEFETLIQSLYPGQIEEQQILAFMLVTGFEGWLWLKSPTSDSPLAVGCNLDLTKRLFFDGDFECLEGCSIVYRTFIT